MSADLVAFVDSNVLVYAVSKDEPEKQRQAQMIVGRGFAEGCFAISTQVLGLAQRARISPWDAAILTAARQSGCTRVLSEDLAEGQAYGGVTVVNPFAAGARCELV